VSANGKEKKTSLLSYGIIVNFDYSRLQAQVLDTLQSTKPAKDKDNQNGNFR